MSIISIQISKWKFRNDQLEINPISLIFGGLKQLHYFSNDQLLNQNIDFILKWQGNQRNNKDKR